MGLASEPSAELRIIAARRSIATHVKELWSFRELLGGLVRKELKVRYKNSALGFVWSMLQPLFLLVVYGFAFTLLGAGFRDFPIWLLSGLLVWTLVSTTLVTSVQSITTNGSLVGKMPFPRAILPLATFGAALVHFLLQFLTFLGVLLVLRHHVTWSSVWLLPLAVLALAFLLAALSLLLGVANVYARDTQHLLDFGLVAMFWANPIAYEYMRLANWFENRDMPSWFPLANPFISIITTFQRVLYGSASVEGKQLLPDVGAWWYLRNIAIVGGVSMGLLVVALWFFDRVEGNLAEVL